MKDPGIRTLLDLAEQVIDQKDGYWVKIEAWDVGPTLEMPHGIRYSLTLHAPGGKRIPGFDNAHAVKPSKVETGEVQMKVIKIGIASQEQIRKRVLAIAKGKIKPKPGDPKVWFTSMHSLAEVLSDDNRALLQVIRTAKPQSISELADMTGRKQGNLSRTLKTMSRYGLVEMRRTAGSGRAVQPVTKVSRYEIVAA